MNAWNKYVGCGCVALFALACGSKGSDDDGGEAGAGGTSGASTGGTGAATGGTGATTGGTAGTAGSATGGTGGATPATVHYAFDSDVQGWIVEYTSSGTKVDGSAAPLIDKGTVMLEHTATEGDPDVGALQATIPYTSESQYVGFGINVSPGIDLSGSVLTAHVQLASGLAAPAMLMTTPGGAKLYVKTGTGYCYAAGVYNNLTMTGTWMTIRFDVTRLPDYVDPACGDLYDAHDVREIGIQIDTGGMTVTAEEAVVLIDTISY